MSLKNISLILLVLMFSSVFMLLSKLSSLQKKINNSSQNTAKITINETVINATVSNTPEKITKGLSIFDNLAKDGGMLFLLEENSSPRFWMKNMKFPIDIIWIDDNQIVKIDENLPAPDPNTPDYLLETYSPDKPIDMVLEINSGQSNTFNLKTGDRVEIHFN